MAVVVLAIVAVYLDFADDSTVGLAPTPTVESTSLPQRTPTVRVASAPPTPGPRPTATPPPAELALDVGFMHTATLLDDGRVLVAGGLRIGQVRSRDANVQTYDPSSGVWRKASSMAQPRYGHTATLLEDGRVVMVGGRANTILRGAEIYDPRSDIWSQASRLVNAKAHHTAVRIGDGLVMVIGGITLTPDGETATASTEIYDAFSGRWAAASNMEVARASHAGVAFPDGRVLVTGGIGSDDDALASAEMYGPSTGLWAQIESMSEPRVGHTATLLPDGRVLVAGGIASVPNESSGDSAVSLATAEIFDPATGEWSQTGEMADGRVNHMASLMIGGNVVVTGGAREVGATGLEEFGATLASAEIYELATGTWTTVDSLTSGRSFHTSVVLRGGLLMVVGGLIGGGGVLFSPVEVLNPATLTWSQPVSMAARTGAPAPTPPRSPLPTATPRRILGEMTTARFAHHGVAVLPDGRALVAGGWDTPSYSSADANSVNTAAAEVYDPATGEWSAVDDLSTDRGGLTVTGLNDGRVLVVGGIGTTTMGSVTVPNATIFHGSTELFDPSLGTWSETGNLTEKRAWHTATRLDDGRVLVTGGFNERFAARASTEIYDPLSGEWSLAADLNDARAFFHQSVLLLDGRVLVVGGRKRSTSIPVTTAEVYDPKTNQWILLESYSPSSPEPGGTSLLNDGRVLVMGGFLDGEPTAGAGILDPTADTWTLIAPMSETRAGHVSLTLLDGRVLIAGGWGPEGSRRSSAELFDPQTGRWSPVEDMNGPRVRPVAARLLDGRVLVIGGSGVDGLPLASVEIFDPETESWARVAN